MIVKAGSMLSVKGGAFGRNFLFATESQKKGA
jgi:hypothetical protein